MPSTARQFFRDNLLPDVSQLIQTHRDVNPDGRGRRALGHLTRSGVVMLCAAWELYIEEVLVEGAKFLVQDAESPHFLPDPVKGRISQTAKSDTHAFGALKLCGDGWKTVYTDAVLNDVSIFNTPKIGKINELYKKWLGLNDISVNWRHPSASLNAFVEARGAIAHRGANADYVRITRLAELKTMIDELVVDTDRELSDYLYGISHNHRRPWRR